MAKLKEKLWNWGHLEGSHNGYVDFECKMTPEEFAKEYEIPNAFIVSYSGNIKPPFDDFAKRFSGLREVKWSVIGDGSSPLPDAELGDTESILDVLDIGKNITGGIVDDFFAEERMKRFPPEVLKKIKKALNEKGLDFWCVLYNNQLDMDLEKYMECFDGITFWIWECENIVHKEEYFKKVKEIAKGKPVMLGVYLWDYSENAKTVMDSALFEEQVNYYFNLIKEKEIEGTIFCSSTFGDAPFETNQILKKCIREQGDIEID